MLAERLIGLGYSLCIIDPHGDYTTLGALRGVLSVGGEGGLPLTDLVGRLVEHRFGSVIIDLSSFEGVERAAYLQRLLRQIDAERRATGLPHWILWDEAHAVAGEREALMDLLQSPLKGCCLVTYRPEECPPLRAPRSLTSSRCPVASRWIPVRGRIRSSHSPRWMASVRCRQGARG